MQVTDVENLLCYLVSIVKQNNFWGSQIVDKYCMVILFTFLMYCVMNYGAVIHVPRNVIRHLM